MQHQQTIAFAGALLLLGSVLVLGVCGVAFVVALARGSRRAAAWIGALAALYVVGYVVVLCGASARSTEQVLSPGKEKHFCAVDCHLAYSVLDSRGADAVGDDVRRARPLRGRFEVVTVKVRFDETTTSPRRGNSLLTPDPKRFTLSDDRGRRYAPSLEAIDAMAHTPAGAITWQRPLRPGEWFAKELVFDVPPDAHGFRLLIEETDPVYALCIGHESSLGHRKTLLATGT